MHHAHGGNPAMGLQQPQPQHLLTSPTRSANGLDGSDPAMAMMSNGTGDSSGSPPPSRGRSSSLPAFPVSPATPENAGDEAWIYHFPPIGSVHSMGSVHPPPVYAKRSSPVPMGMHGVLRFEMTHFLIELCSAARSVHVEWQQRHQ